MRKYLSLILIVFCSLLLVIHDAQARRFGGGRSFGMQRSMSAFSQSRSYQGFNQSSFNQGQRPGNRWLGPLAGLAAGGLLASLFMGKGIGNGLMLLLLIGGGLLLLRSFMRQRVQAVPPNMYHFGTQQNAQPNAFAHSAAHSAFTGQGNNYPIGFDADVFLREAKVQFIRLQAAYDKKDLQDLRDFTTPDVFAEIKMQLQERGDAANQTEVLSLNAELLGIEPQSELAGGAEFQTLIASVRFTGTIQEEMNAPAINCNEIWHFRKEVANSRWLVAGIQQQ